MATDSLADHCAAAAHTTGVTCLLCAEDVDCGAPLTDRETVQVDISDSAGRDISDYFEEYPCGWIKHIF
jgi:hypothetical protein